MADLCRSSYFWRRTWGLPESKRCVCAGYWQDGHTQHLPESGSGGWAARPNTLAGVFRIGAAILLSHPTHCRFERNGGATGVAGGGVCCVPRSVHIWLGVETYLPLHHACIIVVLGDAPRGRSATHRNPQAEASVEYVWYSGVQRVLCQRERGGSWVRGSLQHRIDALRSPLPELRQYSEAASIGRLLFEHPTGRRDHSAISRRFIVFDYWLAAVKERYLGHPPKVTGPLVMQVDLRNSLVS